MKGFWFWPELGLLEDSGVKNHDPRTGMDVDTRFWNFIPIIEIRRI